MTNWSICITWLTILMPCLKRVNEIALQGIEVLVNDSTYISCSPNEPMHIQWKHTGNSGSKEFVYAGGKFYNPYKGRLQIDNYNLIIPSAKSDDAGLYECSEEISGRILNTVRLTVLDSNPLCGSNMKPHGYVGPSTCKLEQENMTFTCAVSFNGDPPQMIWTILNDSQPFNESTCETENGRINCSLILRADSKYDGSTFVCRSTKSSANCSTDVIKIQYFESELKLVEKNIRDEVSCSVKSNQVLQFKWTQAKGNEYAILVKDQTMLIQNHGFYRCMVEYRIRHAACSGFGTEVIVSNPSINSSENGRVTAAIIVLSLIVVGELAVIIKLLVDRFRSRIIEQRVDMPYIKAIKRNYTILRRCTDVNFRVIDCLAGDRILTQPQEHRIRSETDQDKRIELLFQWLKENRDVEKFNSFLCVMEMEDVAQHHVANLLKGITEGESAPMSEARYARLRSIRNRLANIIKGLDANAEADISCLLRRLKAISETEFETIRSHDAGYNRSSMLVGAIMRRSNGAYDSFKQALIHLQQEEAAEFLEEGYMINVHAKTTPPNLEDLLSRRLSNLTREERNLLAHPHEFNLQIAVAEPGSSIKVFIYCRRTDNLKKFVETFNSGELKEILCTILNKLLLLIEPENTDGLKAELSIDEMEKRTIEEIAGIYDSNSDDKRRQSNSDNERSQSNSDVKGSQSDSEEESSLSDSDKKVISMLTSESFIRAIEKGDNKAVTEFLWSSWTFHARRYEASCVALIDRKFLLNIYNVIIFGERAIKLAAKNGNAKAFSLITSALFLKAAKTGDECSVKRLLNGSRNERSMRFDPLCIKSFKRKFIVNVEAFDMYSLLGSCISFSDWLEAIAISPRRILLELLNFEKIVDGVTTNGWTALHLVLFHLQSQFEKKDRTILMRLLKYRNIDVNSSTDEMETILHFACRCSVSNEQFTLFMRELLKHRLNVNQRNSFGQTALMIACRNGNVTAVREILEWRDDDGKRVDISAKDENEQTALSFAYLSNNADIAAMIEENLFHQIVAEYLGTKYDSRKLKTIDFFLKSRKFSANVLNFQNKTIFEIVCETKPKDYSQIDRLLQILLQNGIDLNGRNYQQETFLMLACKYRRIDIVHSLINLTSSGFFLEIDADDIFCETALMKAKENNDSKIVAALLIFKLIYALEDKKEGNVKFILDEFCNTSNIFMKSWDSYQDCWYVGEEKENKFDNWRDAMIIAMEKDTKRSEEILKILLDDEILLSIEAEIGCPIIHRLILGKKENQNKKLHHLVEEKVDDDKKLRLIALLLESGKINVNDRDKLGRTAIHWTEDEKLASLLIQHGADVNRKDKEGKTPLMKSGLPIRTILEEAGILVDVNAINCEGQTALMIAVLCRSSDAVELFLNAGASVNLSDHIGFTALHYALYGRFWEPVEFPRNYEELRKRMEMALFFDAVKRHKRCNWYEENNESSEERMKIIEMLLRRPDIDVNALSIEKFSPLDIAEGQIPQTPPSIINALKDKGSVLHVFREKESQSTSEFYLDVRCGLTLHRLAYDLIEDGSKSINLILEVLSTSIRTFKEPLASGKDQQGRTALHLAAASSFYDFKEKDKKKGIHLAEAIVNELISLGCSVNETDNFGRTPLHYANNVLWKLLISHGADASIKDKGGNSAIDNTSLLSRMNYCIVKPVILPTEETYSVALKNNKQMEINAHSDSDSDSEEVPDFRREKVKNNDVPRSLWEKCEYAARHPLVEEITEEVKDLMNAIAKEIERLDQRFAIRSILVGGSNEGTKTDKPDEFDFCFVLTKISELCEVSQYPELPTGFVRLKRKPTKVGETRDFDDLFREDGILNTEKLNRQFAKILWNAMINVEGQRKFEWILILKNKYMIFTEKVTTIWMRKPLNFTSVNDISVDIVPCIHIDGWWPDDAISNVSDEIKKFGCNLIFDGPQQLYPWVPYSESCVRISFSKAESDMIKQSCDSAREAYMIGKAMIEGSLSKSKYGLKNCLLYCIEALTPTSEKASQLGLSPNELVSKFHKMDRYLWLKCLMKCYLEFVSQDFCPSYFLPKYSSIMGSKQFQESLHFKELSLDWIANRIPDISNPPFPELCKNACALYRCTSADISESSYNLPAPDPLWECFDRKQLIASLCDIVYK